MTRIEIRILSVLSVAKLVVGLRNRRGERTLGIAPEIESRHGRDTQARRRQKDLIRIGQIIHLVNPFEQRDEVFVCDIDDAFACDARERAAAQRRRMERAILRPKQVRRCR